MNESVRRRLLQLEQYLRGRLFGLEEEAVRGVMGYFLESARVMATSFYRAFGLASANGWRLTDPAAKVRNDALLRELDDAASRLLQVSGETLARRIAAAYRAAYYAKAWMLNQAGTAPRFGPLPTQAVAAAVNAPYEGSTFWENMAGARLDFIRNIRKSIVQSQIAGDGIYAVQKRLAAALGWDISRRTRALKARNQGLFARTERIARTEILRTSNMGMDAVMRQNSDVLDGWEWISARDRRVCSICSPLDGKKFPLKGSARRPPRHPL